MKLKMNESLIPKYDDEPRTVYGVIFPSVFVIISICGGYELFINNRMAPKRSLVISYYKIANYTV